MVQETGILRGRRRRAVDPAILADAVATQDTVTQLISAIRKVAREVPGAAEQVAAVCTGHDYSVLGKPKIDWDDPAAREALVSALVNDANALVAALRPEDSEQPEAPAVALLAAALDETLAGRRPFDDAMVGYQRCRDARVLPMYEFTTQLGNLEPPPPQLQRLVVGSVGVRRRWTGSSACSPAPSHPPSSSLWTRGPARDHEGAGAAGNARRHGYNLARQTAYRPRTRRRSRRFPARFRRVRR